MKKCKKCNKLKQNVFFNKNKNSIDGRNKHCNECMTKYYKNKYKIPKLDYYGDNNICEGMNYVDYIKQDTSLSSEEKKNALIKFRRHT